jgi:hypothetical protein
MAEAVLSGCICADALMTTGPVKIIGNMSNNDFNFFITGLTRSRYKYYALHTGRFGQSRAQHRMRGSNSKPSIERCRYFDAIIVPNKSICTAHLRSP